MKPEKCRKCGRTRGDHKAKTFGCPLGRRTGIGYTHFSKVDKFELKWTMPKNARLFVEVVTKKVAGSVAQSTLRKATPSDVAEAKKRFKAGKCPHSVIFDQEGFIYDVRKCATCGAGLGAI